MKLISPTGNWNVRNDGAGQGSYGAPRGRRLHNGVDLQCVPGQDIYAPISGKIVRVAYPYVGDLKWTGFLIVGDQIRVKIFYARLLRHYENNLPLDVQANRTIAKAQDVTRRYPNEPDMTPHIHMELEVLQRVDPMEYIS
jgi:hypothetical protein